MLINYICEFFYVWFSLQRLADTAEDADLYHEFNATLQVRPNFVSIIKHYI